MGCYLLCTHRLSDVLHTLHKERAEIPEEHLFTLILQRKKDFDQKGGMYIRTLIIWQESVTSLRCGSEYPKYEKHAGVLLRYLGCALMINEEELPFK